MWVMYSEIRQLKQIGLKKSKVARKLDVNAMTVMKYWDKTPKQFAEADNQTKSIRNEKIYDAHVKYGYTLKKILDFLGIHYTIVSKVIQKMGQK